MNPDGRGRLWAMRGLLIAAGLIVYWNSLGGAFVFDDLPHIVQRTDHLSLPIAGVVGGERRPLVSLTLAMNHRLGGLDPLGYHVFNLCVHLFAALLLFELIRRSTDLLSVGGGASLAFASALLWVVHPLGTAAVSYVIQRAESMAALFMIATLLCVLLTTQKRSASWTVLAVCSCMLGMASKATMVVAPPLAFAFDALVVSGSVGEAWRRRWGLHLTLAATWGILAVTGVFGAVFGAPPAGGSGVGFAVGTVSVGEYFRSQPWVVMGYVGQSFWPATLCIDPARPIAGSVAVVVAPSALIILAGLGTLLLAWRRHALAFPAVAFFVLLAPTSSIVPIRDLAAEHRMYLPLAALIILVASLVRSGLERLPGHLGGGRLELVMLVVACAALGIRTIQRNADYATPVTLWSSTVAAAPSNDRARTNLGYALREAGRNDEAIDAFESALELAPNDPTTLLNYGAALVDSGRPDEAIAPIQRALPAFAGRARPLLLLGEAFRGAGRPNAAIQAYQRAYEIAPVASIDLVLGNVLAEAGRDGEAEQAFGRAAERAEDDQLRASALFNLGNLHFRRGEDDSAIEAYLAALEADPTHAGARRWLDEAQRRKDDP